MVFARFKASSLALVGRRLNPMVGPGLDSILLLTEGKRHLHLFGGLVRRPFAGVAGKVNVLFNLVYADVVAIFFYRGDGRGAATNEAVNHQVFRIG